MPDIPGSWIYDNQVRVVLPRQIERLYPILRLQDVVAAHLQQGVKEHPV
jgi:hypothetical protein